MLNEIRTKTWINNSFSEHLLIVAKIVLVYGFGDVDHRILDLLFGKLYDSRVLVGCFEIIPGLVPVSDRVDITDGVEFEAGKQIGD